MEPKIPVPHWATALIPGAGVGLGAALLALGMFGMDGLVDKRVVNMTKMERTFASLVSQLIAHIESIETDNEALRKRATPELQRSLDEQIAVLKRERDSQTNTIEMLRQNLVDRDRLIATLREPHVVPKTKRRR